MKDYIITLICVSVFSGIIEILSPDSAGDSLRKQIRLITSLCVLCVAISPIAGVISGISGAEFDFLSDYTDREELESKYEEIFKNNLGEHTAESVASESAQMLCESLGIDTDDLEVHLSLVDLEGELTARDVTVTLYRSAVATDPRIISDYIEELLGCKCEIIYG